MAKRKTAAELKAEYEKQKERTEGLRKRMEEAAKAEEAKVNAEIIKELKRWNSLRSKPSKWEDMPDVVRGWIAKLEEKQAEQSKPDLVNPDQSA